MTNADFNMQRRRVLLALGAAGAGWLGAPAQAQSLPACVVTPAQTEGPFFVDERLNRSDIRGDPHDGSLRPGVALALTLRTFAVGAAGCTPLTGAVVDVWHCDAAGVYSGTTDAGPRGQERKFLRGYQLSNAGGETRFTTIYPGWYPGRAIHIHFKVRAKSAAGHNVEFTSQLYFDEAVNERVMAMPPYAARGPRRVRNDSDGLFRRGGQMLIASTAARGEGYAASFDIGLRV